MRCVLAGADRAVASAFGTPAEQFVFRDSDSGCGGSPRGPAPLGSARACSVSPTPFFAELRVLGFEISDVIGDAVSSTRAATHTTYTRGPR